MIKRYGVFSFLLSFLLFLSIFIASLFSPLDPDLGWHLKYGEYFFENNSMLRDNTFSVLMPDYRWVNSSWATDLISYQTFNNFGFIGLSVLGATIITATFFFIGKAASLSLFEKSIIFPMLFYFTLPVNQISFRGQLLSLLFMTLMFYILSKFEQTNRKGFLLLIPLFTIWSNFHGEFILGLALFLIWTVVYSAKEIYLNYKTRFKDFFIENKFLFLAFTGSTFAAIINPFGVGVYLETIKHFGDPMQKSVAEWLSPADFSTVWWHLLFTGIVLVLGAALLGAGKRNFDKVPFYFPSLVLFLFTFWIKRYAWPMYYSSVFLFKPVANFFKPNNEKQTLFLTVVLIVSFFALTFWWKFPFDDLRKMGWENYCKETIGCSLGAAEKVIANKLNNSKLLTIYDYGGWLIWNYPEIKPTIDGRMHLWRNEAGYSAFEYYYPIEQNLADIDKSIYNAVLTSHKKPIYERLLELSDKRKWEEVYSDDYSSVFVRK